LNNHFVEELEWKIGAGQGLFILTVSKQIGILWQQYNSFNAVPSAIRFSNSLCYLGTNTTNPFAFTRVMKPSSCTVLSLKYISVNNSVELLEHACAIRCRWLITWEASILGKVQFTFRHSFDFEHVQLHGDWVNTDCVSK
jgi:hypothetical protein